LTDVVRTLQGSLPVGARGSLWAAVTAAFVAADSIGTHTDPSSSCHYFRVHSTPSVLLPPKERSLPNGAIVSGSRLVEIRLHLWRILARFRDWHTHGALSPARNFWNSCWALSSDSFSSACLERHVCYAWLNLLILVHHTSGQHFRCNRAQR